MKQKNYTSSSGLPRGSSNPADTILDPRGKPEDDEKLSEPNK